MVLLGTVELETARMRLRRFVMDDEQSMYRNWAGREGCCRYLPWPPCAEVKDAEQIIRKLLEMYDDRYCQWAVVLKQTGELIGTINLHHIEEKDD